MASLMAGAAAASSRGGNAPLPDNLDETERKVLARGGVNEADSDEDGGPRTRFEFDSDFSDAEEEDEVALGAAGGAAAGAAGADEGEGGEGWAPLLSQQRAKGNTGAKGVLADYKEAQRIQARRNETKALKQRELLKATAGLSVSDGAAPSVSLSAEDARRRADKARQEEQRKREDAASDEGEEGAGAGAGGGDDDAVLRAFRAERLAQFRAVAGLPTFGRVLGVSKFEFVDEVDNADPRTHVVVHIYEDYLQACRRMNDVLASLASRFPHVKFMRLLATEADQTLSHSVLPAFLVYRGGKRCGSAALTSARSDFAGAAFSEDDVVFFLATRYGVPFPGVDVHKREARRAVAQQEEEEASAGVASVRTAQLASGGGGEW